MSTEIKTPVLPESVADAQVISWFKKTGDAVQQDEPLLELETDKVVLEVPSPVSGILESIAELEGATVIGEQVLGVISEQAVSSVESTEAPSDSPAEDEIPASPSVRKAIRENDLEADDIQGSGKHGRILKTDVDAATQARTTTTSSTTTDTTGSRVQERVPMTRLRKKIAERLHEATQATAMLTTFNEVNMQAMMDMRTRYKKQFEKTHKTRLGLMSLFVKASTLALQRFPEINASIDGDDIVYHGYCDIGIAISSPRGLVVPILRNTEFMDMAEIESTITQYASQARSGKLNLEDLQGGTFTITNGGVFGSLLSTPILNPPQSAILGMHGITKRPVVENDEIVIRPMMYVALSYDHRIIDGQSAVLFLKTIKELVEDPQRILLDV